jgi:nitroreductase
VNTTLAIAARRSIRKFEDRPIPDEILRAILTAGMQAPSASNRQPWRFLVVTGDERAEMVRTMRRGLTNAKAAGIALGSSQRSAEIMGEAPATVFAINPDGLHPWLTRSIEQVFTDMADLQSIGAAIQNMLLAALELGVGSLWICDVFYAYGELQEWLAEPGQMIAAVAFGYPAENPDARPRLPLEKVARWKR